MANGADKLRPIGFGVGEPDLRSLYDFFLTTRSYAVRTVSVNLVVSLAAQYFSYSFVPPASACLTGLTTALTYPLTKKGIQHLPVHVQKLANHKHKESALLVLSVLAVSVAMNQIFNGARLLHSLSLSLIDATIIYTFAEVRWGSNQ